MTMSHGSRESVREIYTPTHPEEHDHPEGRFCRLFHAENRLPPHTAPTHRLSRLGRPGGPMDEGTGTDRVSDSDVPAGFTFFAQFIDHDITLDPVSHLDQPSDPANLLNFRSPNLDLDCVYGAGPEASPYLYKSDRSLVVQRRRESGSSTRFDDLPRVGGTNTAIIGDPRNDENIFISQLQLAFIKFHNQVLRDEPEHDFETARDTVIHYYHRAILEDLLPRILDAGQLEDICNNGIVYYAHALEAERPCMPVEFSVAAYRFGHSQVRAKYDINDNFRDMDLFDRGGFMRPQTFVDWKYLFELNGGSSTLFARKIDTKLPAVLMNLPARVASNPSSLAQRNLLRGRVFRLPAGQTVARKMAADGLIADSDVLDPDATVEALGMKDTPLWYYILQEAQVMGSGNKLGPVGSRIVGEVLVGLLEHYRNRTGKGLDYSPAVDIGLADVEHCRITDILTYAGVA
jgi:hypothetical protein